MEYADIHYEYKHQTEDAVLIFDGDRNCWIPKSCIENGDIMEFELNTIISVEEWFAKKEGLI